MLSRCITPVRTTNHSKLTKSLKPKLIRQQFTFKSNINGTIIKGSAATLSVYASTGVIPLEWISALMGGSMIGSSASMYLLLHGRIAGISGMTARAWDHTCNLFMKSPKFAIAPCSTYGFLFGMFASSYYLNYVSKKENGLKMNWSSNNKIEPFSQTDIHPLMMLLGGILVGVGTRVGGGCTSGHGVCGLARRSKRSVVAVSSFMACSAITATATNKCCKPYFNYKWNKNAEISQVLSKYAYPVLTAALLVAAIRSGMRGIDGERFLSTLSGTVLCGSLCGTGLVYSGMCKPSKIRAFLDFGDVMNWDSFQMNWDPSLAFVFAGALGVSFLCFPIITRRLKQPLFHKMFHLPTSNTIDKQLVIGSGLFGVGWGISGVCPGPGFMVLSSEKYSSPMWVWSAGILIGMRLHTPFMLLL